MTATSLPRDKLGHPIPAMFPKTPHSVSVSNTTARTSANFAADTRVVALYVTQDCFIKFGDATVEATSSDIFIPAMTWLEFSCVEDGTQHVRVAAIRSTTDGTLRIVELR